MYRAFLTEKGVVGEMSVRLWEGQVAVLQACGSGIKWKMRENGSVNSVFAER